MPAYYLTILATYLLKPDSVPDYGPYLVFMANLDMYSHRYWGYLAHLWSMSVEQQFYLFWPLILLFLPRRLLPQAIALAILVGVLCQNLIPDREFLWVLPQTCFDTLGIGALLGWVAVERARLLPVAYRTLRLVGVLSLALIAGQHLWGRSLSSTIAPWSPWWWPGLSSTSYGRGMGRPAVFPGFSGIGPCCWWAGSATGSTSPLPLHPVYQQPWAPEGPQRRPPAAQGHHREPVPLPAREPGPAAGPGLALLEVPGAAHLPAEKAPRPREAGRWGTAPAPSGDG